MESKPVDLSHHFKNTDIDIAITSWKQINNEYWLSFFPLDLDDSIQSCIQKNGDIVSRVDFRMQDVNGKLIITFIKDNKTFIFDTTELSEFKFHLIGSAERISFFKDISGNPNAGL